MPLTRRLILQKARRHPAGLRRIVGERFQVLFHSPPGVLFTIPSRYSSAIGHQEVFSLTRWSWQIHGKFQEFAATRVLFRRPCVFAYRALTVYGQLSHTVRLTTRLYHSSEGCQTPHEKSHNPAYATPDKYHTHTV